MKGCYALLVRLAGAKAIRAGNLPARTFPAGFYAYVGSARSGIPARVRRHLRADKKRHWHIDYLLPEVSVSEIFSGETGERLECAIAGEISSRCDSIPGFGASDCRCGSHLFFCPDGGELKSAIISAFESRGLTLEAALPEDYR